MSFRTPFAFGIVTLLGLAGCSAGGTAPGGNSTGTGSGSGAGSSGSGAGSGSGSGAGSTGSTGGIDPGQIDASATCAANLPVTYRDFRAFGESTGHIDFEASARGVYGPDGMLYKGWNDLGCGLVEDALGADSKPVYYAGPATVNQGGPTVRTGVGKLQRKVAGAGCWPSTTGVCNMGTCQPWTFDPPTFAIESATSFNQWYNTGALNSEVKAELVLTETAPGTGTYVFDTNAFFPLDGLGFGNTPGQAHNYHFTTEIHVRFEYKAQQLFTFRGDDDLWIFVNGKLALDVGGQHEDLEGTLNFDAIAGTHGIAVGGSYQMDIFHAERQTSESNFRIETNISCFEPVEVK